MATSSRLRGAAVVALTLLLAACQSDSMGGIAPDDGARLASNKPPNTKADMIAVGDLIFDDSNLSRGKNQACASCHVDAFGYVGADVAEVASPPNPQVFESIGDGFYEGSMNGRFGDRKPPSAAYASYAMPLFYDNQEKTYRGGNFWDGRAQGGSGITAIAAQGIGPFAAGPEHAFGPVCVLWEISQSAYATDFMAATGVDFATLDFPTVWAAYEPKTGIAFPEGCHNTVRTDAAFDSVLQSYPATLGTSAVGALQAAYDKVGEAIGAYEHSPLVNRFSSRFDIPSRAGWTTDELAGEALFFNGSGCAACHNSEKAPQVFTDFSYYNIGVPRNPRNPKGATWKDVGLGHTVNNPAFDGFFKSPTLRNVDKRATSKSAKTYMHNGVFASLETVVHFYNTRDLKACPVGIDYGKGWKRYPTNKDAVSLTKSGVCWPRPDFPNTLVTNVIGGRGPVGNIGLTATDERRLVAYLKTLSDAARP
jgi:cytochrome c peroxidase